MKTLALLFLFCTANLQETEPSADFSHFPKWQRIINDADWRTGMRDGEDDIAALMEVMALYNQDVIEYRTDYENYDVSDYWALPSELKRYGGDCEDYVIAWYIALIGRGFSDSDLRVHIVVHRETGLLHAVLVVKNRWAIDPGAGEHVGGIYDVALAQCRFDNIYSINRLNWRAGQ